MKRNILLFLFAIFFTNIVFAGKYLSIDSCPDASASIAIVDFPENFPKNDLEDFKSDLKSTGFKKIIVLNPKVKVIKTDKFIYYFKIFGSKNSDFIKRLFHIDGEVVFSKEKVNIVHEREGCNLSGIAMVKNGVIVFTPNLNRLYKLIDSDYFSAKYSEIILDNNNFVDCWIYDKDYSNVNCEIPLFFAYKDFDYFIKSLVEIHPGPLNGRFLFDFIDLEINCYAMLAKYSKNGYIRVKDLMKVLKEVTNFIKDGHTNIWYWYKVNNKNSKDIGFPPFVLDYRGGDFYIKKVNTKIPEKFKGARVLSINGKKPSEFFKPIFKLWSAESISFQAKEFISSQPFYYSFSEILKPKQLMIVETEKGTIKAECIDADAFQRLFKNDRGKNKKEIVTKFFDNGKIGYFFLPEFDYTMDFKKKIDTFFEMTLKRKSKAIIIDIRDNPGGDSSLGYYIISHLTRKPFKMFSAAKLKYSESVLDRFYPWLKGKFEIEGISGFYTNSLNKPLDVKSLFKGKVYVLIDKGVFSSATDFAAVVKDFKLATLIGYETGGRPTSYGDVLSKRLPFTRVWFGVSWKKFYRPKYSPDNENRGVLPDVQLNEKLLKPYKNEKDPFLEFALHYIKKEIK